jgi:hypothetical protein
MRAGSGTQIQHALAPHAPIAMSVLNVALLTTKGPLAQSHD